MANFTSPRITSGQDLATILANNPELFQLKHDPRGSEVSETDTRTRLGALLQNTVEDWLVALQTGFDGMSAGSAIALDTRTTGAVTTASIAGLASGNFQIAVPKTRMRFDFVRCVSNASELGPTGRLQFFADSGRTKTVYASALKMGDPSADTDDFADTMSWGAFANDGTGLADLILYGTVTNGGAGASTFTVSVVGVGY